MYDIIAKIVTKLKALPDLFSALVQKVDDASQAASSALTSSDIANNLTTETAGKVLDASQGYAINQDITTLKNYRHILATSIENVTIGSLTAGSTKTGSKTLSRVTGSNNWIGILQYTTQTGGATFARSVWFDTITDNTVNLNVAVTSDASSDSTDTICAVLVIWLGA